MYGIIKGKLVDDFYEYGRGDFRLLSFVDEFCFLKKDRKPIYFKYIGMRDKRSMVVEFSCPFYTFGDYDELTGFFKDEVCLYGGSFCESGTVELKLIDFDRKIAKKRVVSSSSHRIRQHSDNTFHDYFCCLRYGTPNDLTKGEGRWFGVESLFMESNDDNGYCDSQLIGRMSYSIRIAFDLKPNTGDEMYFKQFSDYLSNPIGSKTCVSMSLFTNGDKNELELFPMFDVWCICKGTELKDELAIVELDDCRLVTHIQQSTLENSNFIDKSL